MTFALSSGALIIDGMNKPSFAIGAIVLALTIGIPESFAQAQRSTTQAKTPIYRSQSTSSELLGTYPAGAGVAYEFTNNPQWVRIFFSRDLKGTRSGYALASNVAGASAPQALAQRTNQHLKKNAISREETAYSGATPYWMSLGLEWTAAVPRTALITMGAPEDTITISKYEAKLQVPLSTSGNLLGYFLMGMESFNHTPFSSTMIKGTGYSVGAGAQYVVLKRKYLTAALGAGLAPFLYSVSAESVGSITENPIVFGLSWEIPRFTLMIPFYSSLGLEFNLSYQRKVLGGAALAGMTASIKGDIDLGEWLPGCYFV